MSVRPKRRTAGRILVLTWVAAHADEVYFRDTAHGFLARAVASLTTAALLTSVIGSILGMGVQVGATVAADAVSAGYAVAAGGIAGGSPDVSRAGSGDPTSYLIDSFREAAAAPREAASAGTDSPAALPAQPKTPTPALPDASAEAMNVEAARILYSAVSGPSALRRPVLSRPGRAAHRHDAAAGGGPRQRNLHPSSDHGA